MNNQLAPNTTLSHYRVLAKLGQGGMGEVYLAEDITLGRRVALKLLTREHTQDAERLRRFKQEAKAASALNHPNILTIHEVGQVDGHQFIATEFIEGETLRVLLSRNGPMKTAEALRVAEQIASALVAAHEADIVHRDIKPENIMIRRDGYVKVLDFGLAKLTEIATQPVDTNASTKSFAAHTASGVVVGTAQYMSPEQATGKKVDARSDIFSFGAVLYEMVSGERAFQRDSTMETMAAILNEEPKPLPPSIPVDLAKIIVRSLRKDPKRRYQTMADLKVALEDLQEESASTSQHHPRTRLPWIAAGLGLILLMVGLLMWRPWRAQETSEPLRVEALTTLVGQERYPSLSPDGNYVAFTWTGARQDNQDIYVQQIGAGAPLRRTTDPRNEYNPVWSPDGQWIAFLRGDQSTPLGRSAREVRLIAPLGGTERKLADIRVQEITDNPVYLTWCADSRCLVVTDTAGEGQPDALFVVSIDTGDKRQLTLPQPPVLADTNPSLSPRGDLLLFLRRTTWARGELHVLPVRTDMTAAGELRHIPVSGPVPETAIWSSNGDEIIFATSQFSGTAALWRVSAAGDAPPARIPFVGEDGVMPAVSRPQQGKPARLVYVRSFVDENIWRINFSGVDMAGGSPPSVAIASTKEDIHPQLSPDGRRVAFTSTRSGAWEIWTSDLDGSNPVQITFLKAPTGTGTPHWSPDGHTLVFASDVEGQFDIFTVPSEGGKPQNITSHPAFDHVPIFSSDGQWIYFSSTRSGQYQVWKRSLSGGEPVQVTKEGGWLCEESVDGAYLYFTPTAAIGASTELWRMPTSGGPAVKVVDGVRNVPFAVLPRGIYYIKQVSSEPQVHFFDFASKRSVAVVRYLDAFADGFDVSSDGRIALYARLDSSVDDLMLVENFR